MHQRFPPCFIANFKKGFVFFLLSAAFEFQHFLQWQIKCQGNYLKIHFASAFRRQCFCRGSQDFILRATVFTSVTSAETAARSKLVRLLPLLHISPRIRSIMCTIVVAQVLLSKYCYVQCNVLFSHVKNCVLKIILAPADEQVIKE